MVIKPTVGRKVWYRPSAFDLQGVGAMQVAIAGGIPQPLDATIIAVWGDRMVNLLVIDIVGKAFPKLSATLLQDGDASPLLVGGGGYAEWPKLSLPETAVCHDGGGYSPGAGIPGPFR